MVKYLPNKHEGLSSNHQYPHKSQAWQHISVTSMLGQTHPWISLATLSVNIRFSETPYLTKESREQTRKTSQTLHITLIHMHGHPHGHIYIPHTNKRRKLSI